MCISCQVGVPIDSSKISSFGLSILVLSVAVWAGVSVDWSGFFWQVKTEFSRSHKNSKDRHSLRNTSGFGVLMEESKLREAELLLRLFELYSSDSMVDAFVWCVKGFQAESLKDFEELYPVGSDGRKCFFKVGNFLDLLGTFLAREYLPRKMIIDFCPDDVRSFWKIAKKVIIQGRKKWSGPTLYADLESLNKEIEKSQRT